jgi:hypothetical protein
VRWAKARIWRWVDRRGRIPFWVFWLWPKAHWCLEMDELLILDNFSDCFCGIAIQEERKA